MEAFLEIAGAVLGALAYLAVVIAFFVFVAPVIAGLAALYVAGDLVGGYFHRLHAVLVRQDARFYVQLPYVPGTPENGPEPAYRQYFFGPAIRDLRRIVTLGWQRARQRVPVLARRCYDWLPDDEILIFAAWPVAVALLIGLGVGTLLSLLLGGLVIGVHTATVGIVQAGARALAGVLRTADTAALRVKRIRGMRCPWCYERNIYPRYRCPACSRLHQDVRPGRYGVTRRRCACGQAWLPTLLILGSYRLPAVCTYGDHQMSDETGRFRELVLPLLGGRAAGKTRLMAAMLVALHELARGDAAGLRLANAETREAYDHLSKVLDGNGHIRSTRDDVLPHAHSVLLRTGRANRLLHIFDPSGERLDSRERTDALRYLQDGRTFLFVLDPMSAAGFWESLGPGEAARLDRTLASDRRPDHVYALATDQLRDLRVPLRKSRLAVAISKTDLVGHTSVYRERQDGQQWVRDWLGARLGLGNLVRLMDAEFGEVRFFFTAAVTRAPREADRSIHPVLSWSLRIPASLEP
jgi:Double-GTPase 2